ncbi:potassium channel family protein [Paraglaciecola hydrolytica]|uniref:Potassium channel protein n=1 Tax=Paraglaciecola hydrolytica TaxID=1799789 RepID=A0A135ZZV7_9ALTE|nr:potassium channel family protein [Paraglaciecola hydrolytica]KXI28538.1 potassium channel protein [Paraglaciecola hydrolytica]
MLSVKVRKLIIRVFADMRWYSIVLALFFYACTSWILLWLAGEENLTQTTNFIYWLAVTGSTVGYGDLAPSTTAGKYIVSFYVIPLGLSIFALILGHGAKWVSDQWQKGVRGLKDLHVENHILVLGWNGQRTMRLLNLLIREKKSVAENPTIVLCVRAEITNPLPDDIEFVKVTTFSNDQDMDRACVARAKVILMDNPEDDLTMTTALYCSQRNPNAQMVAYFNDETLVPLLQKHCPNVECTPSVAVEMLAKAAFDPGSSLLHHDLLDVDEGNAQYSVSIPENVSPLLVSKLFIGLKRDYRATLIGLSRAHQKLSIEVNPDLDQIVNPGDKIFYIADERIQRFNWNEFSGEKYV